MARILRHLLGTMKKIKTRTITTNGNENEEIKENLIRTFMNNNRLTMENGILWNIALRENMFMTKPFGTQGCLQYNHQTIPKVYWTFSLKNFFGQLWKKKKGNDPSCETKKKKKKIKKPKCAKKKSKKRCSKTKQTCLDPSKKKKKEDPCKEVKAKEDPCKEIKDPCKEAKPKKEDPCKEMKKDPCKEAKPKKEDPCKEMKKDPCKEAKPKKEDPCKEMKKDPCKEAKPKKEDPCKEMKKDPCKEAKPKKEDPCKEMKKDPCKEAKPKKEDPCKEMKKDPCKEAKPKKKDPCKETKPKKGDPCKKVKAKKKDPCKEVKAKKADPCKDLKAKKKDPCKEEKAKKADPCKEEKAKKSDPCKEVKAKKKDPCKEEKAKKADPCKKKDAKKEDPCKKKDAKKADPCKDVKAKKKDPCKEEKAKKKDPCKEMKKDPCKEAKPKKEDPCKEMKKDPCKEAKPKKEDPCKEMKKDPCKEAKPKKKDPCKETKPKKGDPCKKVKAEKKDPCKEVKAKKADPCKDLKAKKADPCKDVKAKKEDPCKMKDDYGKEKDPCAKITKSTIMEPFVVGTRGSDAFIKQFPITTLLTANSAISHRLVPSYTKVTVRGLKQLNRNFKTLHKAKNKKWSKLSNKIIKGKVGKRSLNKQTRLDVMPPSVSVSCNSMKLLDQATIGLNNCIVHMSHYKINRIPEVFNIKKRLNLLRSLIGYDTDEDITRGKFYQKVLNSKIETTKQVLLSFRMQQRKEINNNCSQIPEKLPILEEQSDACMVYGPNILQILSKFFHLNKADIGNELGRKVFSFKDNSLSDKNSKPLPIITECCKQIICFKPGFESSSLTFKILLKLDSYVRGFLDKNHFITPIDILKSKIAKELPHCWKRESKSGVYINSNNLNERILKTFLIKGEEGPVDCSNMKLDRFRNLSFRNEKAHKVLKYIEPIIKLNEKSTYIQSLNDNISTLDGTNSVDLPFEKLGDRAFFSKSLGLLVYWSSKIGSHCIQIDKIDDLQQNYKSLDANGITINILNPSISSNGIQFFIDLEKCDRMKHGKTKQRTCHDPEVESPIDSLFNEGEPYWPFYNECHKRIKDPNTYQPGSDPNANNMLFGNI